MKSNFLKIGIFLLIFLLLFTPRLLLAENLEERLDLNGAWLFTLDPHNQGEEEGWFRGDFNPQEWTKIKVPHTWGVMENLEDYEGYAWYRRSFSIPDSWQEYTIRLNFDATNYLSKVWLNGSAIGSHEGGYTPYSFDISKILHYGKENVVVVKLDNIMAEDRLPPKDNGLMRLITRDEKGASYYDWWNYGGIIRDIYLVATNPIFIQSQRIISVPDLVDSADLHIKVTLNNTSSSEAKVTLKAQVYDEATGELVWGPENDSNLEASLTILRDSSEEFSFTATMPDPKLWHFDHPNLYTLTTKVIDEEGNILHGQSNNFGMRKIELKEGKLYLNGEAVRLVGVMRHADSPLYGSAETSIIMNTDYEDLKKLNTVLSRPAYYPQHDFIMNFCDRNGILLIPEVPAWGLTAEQLSNPRIQKLQRQMLEEMIKKDFNHPCVWAWSLGNGLASTTEEGKGFIRENYQWVKTLDPSRYVSFASEWVGRNPEEDASSLVDFIMMNEYYGTWHGSESNLLAPALDKIHTLYPDKAVIISEFGYATDAGEASKLGRNIRVDIIREHLGIIKNKDFVVGVVFKSYQDYKNHFGLDTERVLPIHMGLVTEARVPKESYEAIKNYYSPLVLETLEHDASEFEAGRGVTTSLSFWCRGPYNHEIPVYTLKDYSLSWEITDVNGEKIFGQGEVNLPELKPEDYWDGSFIWEVPESEFSYLLKVQAKRPTGFPVLEKIDTMTLSGVSEILLYYVDAGDSSPEVLEENEVLGGYNSLEDQAYGLDPVTGKKWGYLAPGKAPACISDRAHLGKESESEVYDDMRRVHTKADIGLTYKFELPQGLFKVVLGFYDGWNKATRFMDVYIEDVLKEEAMLVGTNITEKVYPIIRVEDGELEIRVAKNPSATGLFDDPIINAIWVYQLSQDK